MRRLTPGCVFFFAVAVSSAGTCLAEDPRYEYTADGVPFGSQREANSSQRGPGYALSNERDASYRTSDPDKIVSPVSAVAQQNLMQEYYVNYDRGLVFRPYDPQKNPFELKFNSWLQLRHTYFDSDGPNRDENDIDFERLRILFSGIAITRDLKYFIQIDMDDDQVQRLDALDYYITFDFGRHFFDQKPGSLAVRAGRWKIPFNRSRYTSGLKLQFADRSIAGVFFDIDRSVGVSLLGREMINEAPINWEVAVVNGIRTNGLRTARAGDLDRNLALTGRVFSDVIGTYGNDGEPDLSFHEELAVRIGGGFAFSRIDGGEGPAEFSRQRVVDSGATIDAITPAGTDRYTMAMYEFDVNAKYKGFSLLTEFFFRHLYEFNGGVPSLCDHGFLLQTGYFIIPKKLELLARWSRIVGDSGTLGRNDHSLDEVAGGIAWYIKGANAKIVFDVSHFNGAPINDTALNIRPGDAGWLFRTQLQLWY